MDDYKTHAPDWSDWGFDHPEEGSSCRCGFNGTYDECRASRDAGGDKTDD